MTARAFARSPVLRPSRGLAAVALAIAITTSVTAAILFPAEAYVVLLVLPFSVVGLILVSRRPTHPVGWLFSGFGLTFGVSVFANAYGTVGLSAEPAWSGAALAAWAFRWLWIVYVTQLELALLLFPTGRFASQWWKRFAWLVVALNGTLAVLLALFGEAIGDFAVIVLPFMLVALGSPLARLRHTSGVEREQIKWVASAGVFLVLAQVVGGAFGTIGADAELARSVSNAMYVLGVISVPVAMGVAILRFHLYDIDIVVNRALVYAPTTAAIGACFFAAIIILQTALRPFTSGSEITVAISTLVSIALFQPARRRIQQAVDRRFYRSKYDAERTLDAFAARLREQIDLAALERELLVVVDETLQPVRAGVWLRKVAPR